MAAFGESASSERWLTARAAPQHGGRLRALATSVAATLPPRRPRLWTLQYVLSLMGTFSFFACFFYLTTTLPTELIDIGASLFEIGLIVGGYNLISIVLRPFVGRWSDAGHRVLLMRIGLIAFAGSFALMIFASDVWTLFALRCAHGVAMSAYPTAAGSMVAEIVPQPRRGEGLGFFGMSTSVAQTAMPLLGGIVAVFGGFDAVLIVGVVTAGVSLAVTLLQREPHKERVTPPPIRLATLVPARAVFPMLVFLSVTLGFSVAAAFLPSLADDTEGRNLGFLGLFFLCSGLGAMVTRPLAGRISDRIGRVSVIVPGLIATAVGMTVLAEASTPYMLWIAGLLSGVGMGAAHTGLLALAVDRVGATQRGGATATFQLAWDVGGFMAGPPLAVIGILLSVEMIFWAAVLGAVVALGVLLLGRTMGWTRPAPLPAPIGAVAGGG